MITPTESTIREFIVDNYLFREDTPLSAEDSLIASGLIDSTGIQELVTFLETTYGFEIEDEEIVPENLESIGQITAFVQRKLQEEALVAA